MFSVCVFWCWMAGWRAYSSLVSTSWLHSGLRVCAMDPIGCTNNNYASREKCKKCGQPKELAAMPAVAIPGASVPTHPTYFARTRGGMEQMMNVGSFHPSVSLSSGWSVGGASQYGNQPSDPYGLQSASNWPLGGGSISGLPYSSQPNQLPSVPNGNGWRNGDWMCTCGFHNYSSRLQVCSIIISIQAENYAQSFEFRINHEKCRKR